MKNNHTYSKEYVSGKNVSKKGGDINGKYTRIIKK